MNTNALTIALLLALSRHLTIAAEEPNKLTPEAAFKEAASLMQRGQHKEAIPYLERVQQEHPDNASVLWNLGIAQAEIGNHREAVKVWESYRKLAPNEWQPIAKLIQAYQGLGDTKARDETVKALYDLRKASPNSDVAKAERFCREQWVTPTGRKIFAFEYFDPKGARQKFFRFSVTDAAGTEGFYISLGSYDDTTAISRELGEISKSDRMYHLDEYTKTGHKTYAFFKAKPEYDAVRTNVVNILEGKMKPVSGSSK